MSRVTVRLPDDLHKRLQAVSRSRGLSLNQFIVEAIGEALARDEDTRSRSSPVVTQVKHIRSVLGSLAVGFDITMLPPELRPSERLPDARDYCRSLPKLEPPLLATVIADREDRL